MRQVVEIYGKVARGLGESLNVDEAQITPSATLRGDLGAESIDFLDIVFRLEREFAISIPREELFPDSMFEDKSGFACDGKLTDQGLGAPRSEMSSADPVGLDHGGRPDAGFDQLTVDKAARYIAR